MRTVPGMLLQGLPAFPACCQCSPAAGNTARYPPSRRAGSSPFGLGRASLPENGVGCIGFAGGSLTAWESEGRNVELNRAAVAENCLFDTVGRVTSIQLDQTRSATVLLPLVFLVLICFKFNLMSQSIKLLHEFNHWKSCFLHVPLILTGIILIFNPLSVETLQYARFWSPSNLGHQLCYTTCKDLCDEWHPRITFKVLHCLSVTSWEVMEKGKVKASSWI